MATLGGWAGKILRVNLSTGKISAEDSSKYYDYIGGSGIGYKVMWDEVPEGTKAHDPENKMIFSTGPLTGTGALCSGRMTITSLASWNKYNAVINSHFGGYFASELKYAGWDAVIVEGKASSPVWIKINDNEVSIEDASMMWGKGCFYTMAEIAGELGDQAQSAVIGQAGENLVPISFIRTGSSHHGGGLGDVMGSKMLKAIGVRGTQSVKIAGDKGAWMRLMRENLTVIGANNQHVVPKFPQPWAEFSNPATRWTSAEDKYWGAAEPPVKTGTNPPQDLNRIGFRTLKSILDLTAVAEKYTVRMGGCASCPIRCHSQMKIPQLEQYGYPPYVSSTCVGFFSPGAVMIKGVQDMNGEGLMIARALGAQITNDYGIWCNYLQIGRDFNYAYNKGILKKVLPKAEYDSIRFDLLEAGDPAFLLDFYRRIATKQGEFSHMADGAYLLAKRWGFGDDYWDEEAYGLWNKDFGYPHHHSNEADAQVGTLVNLIKNRDAQNHSHNNFLGSGLPLEIQKEIAAEVWGGGEAIDEPGHYTPMNKPKAVFAAWSLKRNFLHDSLTLCNWMWPMTVSPLKEKGYRGDTAMESKYYTLATGKEISEAELDKEALKLITLHRAITMRQMNTMDMRNEHDLIPKWVFDADKDKKPYDKGTNKLDREDMELAKDMLYEEFGWDKKTGAPTRATLENLGLTDVADELASKGLLPA